jgi:hypothetical protein
MTGGSQALAEAAAAGARATDGLEVVLLRADASNPKTLLDADGYIFAFPENLAAISGVMKAFFDRSYYPCLGQIEGRPYALLVCAGSGWQQCGAAGGTDYHRLAVETASPTAFRSSAPMRRRPRKSSPRKSSLNPIWPRRTNWVRRWRKDSHSGFFSPVYARSSPSARCPMKRASQRFQW